MNFGRRRDGMPAGPPNDIGGRDLSNATQKYKRREAVYAFVLNFFPVLLLTVVGMAIGTTSTTLWKALIQNGATIGLLICMQCCRELIALVQQVHNARVDIIRQQGEQQSLPYDDQTIAPRFETYLLRLRSDLVLHRISVGLSMASWLYVTVVAVLEMSPGYAPSKWAVYVY